MPTSSSTVRPQRLPRSTKPDPAVEAATRVLAHKYPGLDAVLLDDAIRLSLAPPAPQAAAPARLLSAAATADRLGVSIKTVRRLATRGVLKRVKLGWKCDRFTEASVLALIASSN